MSTPERDGNAFTCHPHHLFFFTILLFCFLPLLDLGLPVDAEEICPLLPSLEQAMGEAEELTDAGAAAGQAQYVHVTDVTLPMLCAYVSRWWRDSPVLTSVTPQHASDLLGHVLRIIHNHVGASQGDWMKQLAGSSHVPSRCSAEF